MQQEQSAILRIPRSWSIRRHADIKQPEVVSVNPCELATAVYDHVDHLLIPFDISDGRYLPENDVRFFTERVAAHMLHKIDPHATAIVSEFLPVPLTFQENNDVVYEQSLDDAAGKVVEVLFTQASKFRKHDKLANSFRNIVNGKKAGNIHLDTIDAKWEVNKILRDWANASRQDAVAS